MIYLFFDYPKYIIFLLKNEYQLYIKQMIDIFNIKEDIINKYKYININNFDITKLKIKRDKENGILCDTYSISYDGYDFYIIPSGNFNTYGIQYGNKEIQDDKSFVSDYTDIFYDNKFKKISIIFDDNNNNHLVYKNVIKNIYKKLSDNLKNVKIYNPINNYNAMNIEINDRSVLYELNINSKKLDKIVISDLIKYRYHPFKISPIIYFKKFNKKNDILYFNLCIKYAVIKYDNITSYNTAYNLFNNSEYITNLEETEDINNDIDEINF